MPLRGYTRDNLIRFISHYESHLEPERKSKFNGGGGQGADGAQQCWNQQGDTGFHGYNPDSHTPGNIAGDGIGRGGPCGAVQHDINNGVNGRAQGGQGYNPTPTHQDGQRQQGGGHNNQEGGRST